jgi:glutathione S-transferase
VDRFEFLISFGAICDKTCAWLLTGPNDRVSNMKLYIGNKNYSSWSMRPWVLMREFEIPFEEIWLPFDGFEADSRFKQQILKLSPAGRVPVLVDDDLVAWDTLAIVETLAEKFPDCSLWPAQVAKRARARSVCAEMHSSFSSLRNHCPMNIEARFPEIGARLMRDNAGVRADLQRIVSLWQTELQAHGGPFLFGGFTIADAFYAPVVSRLHTYSLPAPADVRAYMERILATRGVSAWSEGALKEHYFVADNEPYRTTRG